MSLRFKPLLLDIESSGTIFHKVGIRGSVHKSVCKQHLARLETSVFSSCHVDQKEFSSSVDFARVKFASCCHSRTDWKVRVNHADFKEETEGLDLCPWKLENRWGMSVKVGQTTTD